MTHSRLQTDDSGVSCVMRPPSNRNHDPIPTLTLTSRNQDYHRPPISNGLFLGPRASFPQILWNRLRRCSVILLTNKQTI